MLPQSPSKTNGSPKSEAGAIEIRPQLAKKISFRIVSKVLVKKVPAKNRDSFAKTTMNQFSLTNVNAYNIMLNVAFGGGYTRIQLKEVPVFLVNSFEWLLLNGNDTVGIFRKEGNAGRLNRAEVQEVYLGEKPIPGDFSVHDVCTSIKRFLKDLNPTLLSSEGFRNSLMEMGKRAKQFNNYELAHADMVGLFESHPMPPPHVGTLSYLARMLQRISENSEENKMTADNLSVCFVGSFFGDFMGGKEKSTRKSFFKTRKSRGMQLAKDEMDAQVNAVKLLILNSYRIGIRKNPYVASRSVQLEG